jgi:hypothetical protein
MSPAMTSDFFSMVELGFIARKWLSASRIATSHFGSLTRLRHHCCLRLIKRHDGVKIAPIECVKKTLQLFLPARHMA